jgi:hypothetical protein
MKLASVTVETIAKLLMIFHELAGIELVLSYFTCSIFKRDLSSSGNL